MYVVCLFMALAIVNCATGPFQKNPIPDTPKGKYIKARKFYNDQLESLTFYGSVLTAEQKSKMKKELDPVLDSIEATLDGWKIALLDPSANPTQYNTQWTALRAKMLKIIQGYLSQ
jgi:hypothetical protein